MSAMYGHCERCNEVGHVKAHPDLGCADVGCDLLHDDGTPMSDERCPGSGQPVSWGRDFLTTALIHDPHRVGTPLSNALDGVWAARRGSYRALYRINQERREVVVLRIDHRRDAYRPLS